MSDVSAGALDEDLRKALVAAGALLHARGLVAGTAGNLSARRADGVVLVTPRGARMDRLAADELVPIGLGEEDGAALARASTEWPLHRACHRLGGVGAVVHTHAPALTALGLVGADGHERLARALPEMAAAVGGVASAPFAPSGSEELAEAGGSAVEAGSAVLILRRHGALAVGPDLDVAVDRMELAELAARAVLLAE